MADEAAELTYSIQTSGGDVKESSKMFEGKGIATFPNGDVYDGTYSAGKRAGSGTYTWSKNGDKYSGFYSDNVRYGLGLYTYSGTSTDETEEAEQEATVLVNKVSVYHGNYENNLKNGFGTFKYTNGDTYSGKWNDGKKHGKGAYRYSIDGSVLEGTWKAGYLNYGRWVLPNGDFWVGSFNWNQPVGEGVWHIKDNQIFGYYTQVVEESDDDASDDAVEKEIKAPVSIALKWTSLKNVSMVSEGL
jgi:hypothetical protein